MRRRLTPGFMKESAALARAAAEVLSVLRDRHPSRDEAKLALRLALELEANLLPEPTVEGKG